MDYHYLFPSITNLSHCPAKCLFFFCFYCVKEEFSAEAVSITLTKVTLNTYPASFCHQIMVKVKHTFFTLKSKNTLFIRNASIVQLL